MPSLSAVKLGLYLLTVLLLIVFVNGDGDVDPAFQLIASHPGSPIDQQYIHANNLTFWIGKPTLTSCALADKSQCPPGTSTVLHLGGFEMDNSKLYIVGPAGQATWANAVNGVFGFQSSDQTVLCEQSDPGSDCQDGLWKATVDTVGNTLGDFYFIGNGTDGTSKDPPYFGWLACPLHKGGPWQILVHFPGLKDKDVTGGRLKDCITFDMKTQHYASTQAGAYEYD